jgi:Outer membrane protein beta-barrel domain
MRMPHTRTLLTVAAMLLAAPALAAPPQSYFTFGAARGGFEAEAPAGCTITATNDAATGGSLGVGYSFSEHLALEFGFINLGTLDATATCPGPTTVVITAPDSGLQLSGVLSLPLGDAGDARGATLFGRLGGFSWSENAQSGVEPIVGVGFEWRFDFNTAVRVEYDDFGDGLDAIQLTLRWDY